MSMTSDEPGSRAASLPLVGGVLALDFVNTASGRETEGFRENLQSAADLVAWAKHAARARRTGRDAPPTPLRR